MSLVDGEGRVEILYGVSPLPLAPFFDVYLARPDFAGAHPLVVVVAGDAGVTPSLRALCRRVARNGYAALAPDLFHSQPRGSIAALAADRINADLDALLSVTRDEWSRWCASDRFAVLGLGDGVPAAIRLASRPGGAAVISPGSLYELDHVLTAHPAPLLALVGGRSSEEARVIHDSAGRGEWVVYAGAGPGFFDDGSEDYHRPSAEDAFKRLIAFLDGRLTRVGV